MQENKLFTKKPKLNKLYLLSWTQLILQTINTISLISKVL